MPSILKIHSEKKLTALTEAKLAVDIYQTPNHVMIRACIAGVRPNDISINIAKNILTIRGIIYKDPRVRETDYIHQECYFGPFSRSIVLPGNVNTQKVRAVYKNGVVQIALQKK